MVLFDKEAEKNFIITFRNFQNNYRNLLTVREALNLKLIALKSTYIFRGLFCEDNNSYFILGSKKGLQRKKVGLKRVYYFTFSVNSIISLISRFI